MYNHYGGFEFAVTLFFADFSSLFLALRGILLGIGGKKWKITKIVELSFGLSFLAIRLFCQPLGMLFSYESDLLPYECKLVGSLLLWISFYWAFEVLALVLKTMLKKDENGVVQIDPEDAR
eukprot:CAMPEP_0202979574 /NCGR_PEP_ID=MMETSP1396-20130829/85684_1 /ASSEMBLY_ACC=CAM_ASM_000872 /TAXON_ID= /ORGANISM="Pseudokeronopsis sp., Strain Brazil" /LENGTH=120 /DNA_ID=CAMNT_0049719055 /DNA_START=785 /DNA_END=1147 /DNA_ORIENTATION=-